MFARDRRGGTGGMRRGDGSPLPAYRWWQPITRSVFFLRRNDADGVVRQFAFDVGYFDWEDRVSVYTDGAQTSVAALPAAVPVPGGVVEVAAGTFGLTRMHFVRDDGTERMLRPHPRSAEGWRADFASRHPRWSRFIGGAAIAILVVGLVLAVPQLLAMITQVEWVAENFGSFESPVSLPAWLNSTLAVAGVAAAIERALTLRSHWLLDADTFWID